MGLDWQELQDRIGSESQKREAHCTAIWWQILELLEGVILVSERPNLQKPTLSLAQVEAGFGWVPAGSNTTEPEDMVGALGKIAKVQNQTLVPSGVECFVQRDLLLGSRLLFAWANQALDHSMQACHLK